MSKMNITARVGTFASRTAAPLEELAEHRLAPLAADLAAPQKRGTGRPAKALPLVAAQERGIAKSSGLAATQRKRRSQANPMPWCRHPAAADFGKLCTDQLKAYRVKTTGA
jgi:hypothetical protein